MFPPVKRSRKEQTLSLKTCSFASASRTSSEGSFIYEAGIMFYNLSSIFPTSVMRGADERRGAGLQSYRACSLGAHSCFEGVGSPHFFKTDVSGLL